ncbi:MAG: glycosyltransferase family 2 protein [Pyrinomonadaceae bacterium]|nr:glycosyltransferase family 2 protein [Pyrinomonadaceae bacterium]
MANTFSIAMCTYNGARHLSEQLDSISTQSRLPDELVICDDASTDDTRAILTDFAASAPFPVHLHFNERNLGSTKNFECAIRQCTGDMIALCDQDDVWLPEKLSALETKFASVPSVGLIFSDAEVIDESARSAGYTLWEKLSIRNAELRSLRSQRAVDALLQGSTVTGATMAFRGRFKELVLPIPNDLPVIHDAWIALLVAAVSQVFPFATPLIRYRQHSAQQVGAKERVEAEAGVIEAMQRKTSYTEMIQVGAEARQRLADYSGVYESVDAISGLDARLQHLRARASLPEGRLGRVRLVAAELLSRRYHLYSNGFRSAVKDLLF